jgi:8-oxo-dGTP pyrophosphatase MutT (NUDIX family)
MNSKDKLFYVAAKAFIENDAGKLLLLKTSISPHRVIKEAYWDFPGGRLQPGQDVLDALRAEIAEETGIQKITVGDVMTTVISNHLSYIDGREVGLLLVIYNVAVPPESLITLSEEHVAYEWVTAAEAKKRLGHKYPQVFIDNL